MFLFCFGKVSRPNGQRWTPVWSVPKLHNDDHIHDRPLADVPWAETITDRAWLAAHCPSPKLSNAGEHKKSLCCCYCGYCSCCRWGIGYEQQLFMRNERGTKTDTEWPVQCQRIPSGFSLAEGDRVHMHLESKSSEKKSTETILRDV